MHGETPGTEEGRGGSPAENEAAGAGGWGLEGY